jgi:cytosine/adenosine deaminase-related metal-dependent hydrolase
MRLGSGIAPIKTMRARGVAVGLGVDGSASNDAGHLLLEARMALLGARIRQDPPGSGQRDPTALTARQVLEIATRGGASALGRKDIGQLAPGMCADLVAFDLRALNYAGALHDPLAALIFAAPSDVALSVINGRVIVREGCLQTLDLPLLVERHNRLAHQLVAGA